MYKPVIEECKSRMEKTLNSLHYSFNNIRTGRANPKVLDSLKIDYYGTETPINQIAGVSSPEPRILQISPWDAKAITLIEKAILQSDLGLNPNNDGKVIRLIFPELNEERRKDLTKVAKKAAEESKIAIRAIRKDGMEKFKKMEKNTELTEDESRTASDKLQKEVDNFIKKIDEMLEKKVEEIMKVWFMQSFINGRISLPLNQALESLKAYELNLVKTDSNFVLTKKLNDSEFCHERVLNVIINNNKATVIYGNFKDIEDV